MNNIKPCEDYPYCDDTSGYPNDEINNLLSSHLQQQYFKDVLSEHTSRACLETAEATAGNVISGELIQISYFQHLIKTLYENVTL